MTFRRTFSRPSWANFSVRLKIMSVMSVPLAALLVSGTAFMITASGEARAEEAAATARSVRHHTIAVESALQAVDATLWGGSFGVTGTTSLAESEALLASRIQVLRASSANNPSRLQLVSDFEKAVRLRTEVTKTLIAQFAATKTFTPGTPEENAAGALIMSAPQSILRSIAQDTDREVARLSAKAESARKTVQWTILLVTGVGIAGGLVLMTFAVGGIVRRIRRVGENARRLASGETLLPIPSGGDEVSALGRELDEAARLLTERERGIQSAAEDAERANLAKSEFLSRMSHELRTPLNSILGFAQLLNMGNLPAEHRDDVKLILRAGKHLLALIDEVLDISRIEAGEFRYSIEPVRLEDVFAEVAELARPLADQQGIHLSTGPANLVWVQADRQRLKQVLLNLVVNGIKFNTEHGSVLVDAERAGDRVHITVSDTGRGIPEGALTRLFVPFERLDALNDGIEGTGLGLALSKGLVDAMGGTITVSSAIGRGSNFTVDLAKADAPISELLPNADPAAEYSDREGDAAALYIEDNLANVTLIRRILAGNRVRLISAATGELGVELATRHRPSVILLDLNLPDIDGKEVLRRLRANPQTEAIPVIVISADATPSTIAGIHGVHAYLTKPFDVPEFLEVLNTALSARNAT